MIDRDFLIYRTFCPTKPAKSLHTQKNRQFFHEPEENYWMVMVHLSVMFCRDLVSLAKQKKT